jgi:FkbM family methyltransferase
MPHRLKLERNPQIRSFLTYAQSVDSISRSQLSQDAFVLHVLHEKQCGFFCEFGATDGIHLSNSFALEHYYSWRGICAEPARHWHESLRENRPNTIIDPRCVWATSGETLSFIEATSHELSTLKPFSDVDSRRRRDSSATTYNVETVSLNDMLDQHNAPADFDYLSIDTEGSELAILQAFDMTRYRPKIITVEHNYTSNRNAILSLLTAHGYRRVLPEISLFDDWYLVNGVELPAS